MCGGVLDRHGVRLRGLQEALLLIVKHSGLKVVGKPLNDGCFQGSITVIGLVVHSNTPMDTSLSSQTLKEALKTKRTIVQIKAVCSRNVCELFMHLTCQFRISLVGDQWTLRSMTCVVASDRHAVFKKGFGQFSFGQKTCLHHERRLNGHHLGEEQTTNPNSEQ